MNVDGVDINIDLSGVESMKTEALADSHALEEITRQAVAESFREAGLELDINIESHQEAYRQALFHCRMIAKQVIAERGEG